MPSVEPPYCGVWPNTPSDSEVLALIARLRSGRWSLAHAFSSGKKSHPSDGDGNVDSRRFSISCGLAPATKASAGPKTNSSAMASSSRERRSLSGAGMLVSWRFSVAGGSYPPGSVLGSLLNEAPRTGSTGRG